MPRDAVFKTRLLAHPPPSLDTFALSMVNSVDYLSPSRRRFARDDDDDFTLRFRTGERRRGSRVCDARPYVPVVGHRRRFSRPTDGGGNQGNPTHGACTGRAIGVEGEGVPSTDGARIKPPPVPPRTLSYVQHNARRLAPRRYTLSLWKGVH